jgi:cysteine desulfuration protein SufE
MPQHKGNLFSFIADSDSQIVRGLIAVLMFVYNDVPHKEVAKIDIEDIFRRLGLDEHLTPNRRNGFFAMVERIRVLAQS